MWSFFLPVANVKRRSNQHLLWNQITIVPALNIPDSLQCNPQNSNHECVFQPDCEQWAIIYHLTWNLNLFLWLKVKRFRRVQINRKSMGCQCCKPPSYAFIGGCTFAQMKVHSQKLLWIKEIVSMVIILDPLINSNKSGSFQSRYRFCLYSFCCHPLKRRRSIPSSGSSICNIWSL